MQNDEINPETRDARKEKRRQEAAKVLSWLPLTPCGATAAILARDVYGDDNRTSQDKIKANLNAIETVLDVAVSVATDAECYGGRKNSPHYCVAPFPRNKLRASRLVKPVLDQEDTETNTPTTQNARERSQENF